MKRILLASSLITVIFIAAGCVTKSGEFAVVGTKMFDLNKQEFEKVGDNISGESTKHMIFLFPTPPPTIDEAIRDALQKSNGDIMTDTTAYHKFWIIPILYTKSTIEVKGTVWKLKGKP